MTNIPMIRVLIKEVDEPLREAMIPASLESYYNTIDCDYIEIIYPFQEDYPPIIGIIDDEGRLKRKLISWRCDYYGGINGTIIFARDDGMGNTVSLTDEDVAYIKSRCAYAHYATNKDDFDCSFQIYSW